jgi:hypothetical protein
MENGEFIIVNLSPLMRCFLIAVCAALYFPALLAQEVFQPGYIIDLEGQRINVDLRVQDWYRNPERFRYRMADGSMRRDSVKTIREFGLRDGSLRYRAFTVALDRASPVISRMSTSPAPDFDTVTVFLEYLVDGEADLLYWAGNDDTEAFFYRLGDSVPQQLISRDYLLNRQVIDNRGLFRNQLLSDLSCDMNKDISSMAYTREALVDYVRAFNTCRGTESELTLRRVRPSLLRFTISGGGLSLFGDVSDATFPDGDRGYELGRLAPILDIEAEFSLPIGKRRWALLAAGYPLRFSQPLAEGAGELRYRSLNLRAGLRRYMYLRPGLALLLGGGSEFALPIGESELRLPMPFTAFTVRRLDVFRSAALYAEVGVFLQDRYRLSVRYGAVRNLIEPLTAIGSESQYVSLTLGYSFRLGANPKRNP